jgi:hypothetical protein
VYNFKRVGTQQEREDKSEQSPNECQGKSSKFKNCLFIGIYKIRYKRLEQPNGVISRTNSKKLIFYDKIKELKYNKEDNILHGQNLLRYRTAFQKLI